jgi:hypothetical protein
MPVRISADTPPSHIPDPFVSRNAYRLPPHSPMLYASSFIRNPSASPFPPNFHLPPPFPQLLSFPLSPLPSSCARIAYVYLHIYASNPHYYIASFPEYIDDVYSWCCISISPSSSTSSPSLSIIQLCHHPPLHSLPSPGMSSRSFVTFIL